MNLETQKNSDAETSPFLQFKQLQNSQGFFNASAKDKLEEKTQLYQQKNSNLSRSIEKRVKYQNQPSSSVNSSKDVNRSTRASFKEHILEKQLKQQMQQQQKQSTLSRQLKRSKYRENHSLTLFTQYKQHEQQQQQQTLSPTKILPSSSSIQYQQFSKQIVPNMLNFQHRSQSTENQLTQNSNRLIQQSAVGSDKTQLLFESYFVDSTYGKTQNDFAVLRQLKTGNDIETARLSEKRKQSLAQQIDLLLPKRPQTQQDIKSTASWKGEGGEDHFFPSKTQPSWTLNLGPALKNVIFKPEDNFISQGTSATMKAPLFEINQHEKTTTKIISNPMTSLSRIQAEFDRRSTSEHVCSNNSNNNFYTTKKDHYQPTTIKLIQQALQPRQQQLLEEQQQSSPKLIESSSSSSSPYHIRQKLAQQQEKEQEFLKEINKEEEVDQCRSKTVKLLNLQEILRNEDLQDCQQNEVCQKQDDMECSLKDELKASPTNARLSQQAFFPQTKNISQNSLRNVNNNMFPNIVPLNTANSCNFQQTPNGEYFSNPLIMLKTQSKNTNNTNSTRAITTIGATQTQRKNSINSTAVVINNNNNISISPSPRSIKQQSFHLTSRKEKIRPAIQTYLNSRARHPVISQRGSISSQEEPPLFLKISSIKTSSTSKNQQEILPKQQRFSPEKYLIDKQNKPLENSSINGTNAIANVIRINGMQSKEGTPAERKQNQISSPSGILEEAQLGFVPRSQSFTELSRKTLSSFHQYQANKTNKTDVNSEEVFPLIKNNANSIIHEEQKNIKIDVISPGGNKKLSERNQNQNQLRNEGIKDGFEGSNSNKMKSPTQKGSNSNRNLQSVGEQSKILEEENIIQRQNTMNTQEMNSSSFFFKTKKNNNDCSNSLSIQASPRAVINSNNSKQTQQKPKVFSKQFTQIISGRDLTPQQQPSKSQHTSGSQLIRVQTVPNIVEREINQNYFEDLPKKPIKIIQMSAMEQSSLSPLQKQQKQLQQHKADSQQFIQQNQQQLFNTSTTEDLPIKNSIIPMYIRNYSSMQSRNDNSVIYGNIKATDVSLECILKIEDNIDEIKIHLLRGFSQNKNLVELVREFCLIPQEEFIAEMMRFFKFVLETAKKIAKDQLAQEEKSKQTFSLAKEKKDALLEEQSTLSKSSNGSPRQKLLSLKKAAQLIKTANGAIQKMGFTFSHEKESGHGSMKFQIIPKIILDWLVNELHIKFRELCITATEGFFAQYVQLAINNLLPHSLYQELGSERGIRNFIGLVIEKLHEELDFELASLTGSFEVIFNTVQAIVQNDFTFLQSLLVATTTLKLTSVEFYLLKNVIIEVFFAQHRAATSSKEHNNNSNNNHTTPITQQLITNTASQKQPELAAGGGIQDFTKYYNELVLASSNHENNSKNMNSSQLFLQQQKLMGNTPNQPLSAMTTQNKLDQQSSEKLSKQQRAAAATRISRQLFAAEDGCVNRYTRNEILERVEVTRAIILRRSKPIEDPRIISEICFMIAQDRAFLKHRRGQLSSLRSIEAFLTELSSVLFLTREKREGFIAQQQKLIGYVLDVPFWESLKDAYLSVMKKPQNKYLSSRAFLIDLELRFYYILVDANLLERPVFSLLENTSQLVEELFLWVEDQHFQLGSKFTHDLILSYDRRCMTFFLQDAMLYGVYSALDTEYALLYFKIQPDIVQLWMSGIKNILTKPIFQLTPTQQTELTVFLQNLIPID